VESAVERTVEVEYAPWAEFTDQLAGMLLKVNEHFAVNKVIPSQTIHVPQDRRRLEKCELHLFQFPNTIIGQDEVFALMLTPDSGEREETTHYGYAAQKGPPWKDIPMINPG
jgi:hypothetical protein